MSHNARIGVSSHIVRVLSNGKVWGMTGNSTVTGDVRIWTIKYAITSKGNPRKLTFRASTNGVYGVGKTVNVTVK